ncbi:site-specific integrase [Altererythrobacter lauratis]|uniref:Site-specific integrase n=1 Tax=Alteraurantiacibacter lauratis TaxID=2054627 RepID=A0ABV7EEC3_9SPHN
MPSHGTPTLTFAALIRLIMGREEIPLAKRSELCSAIRKFAEVCSLTPGDIIADPAIIRALAAKAPWLLRGYSKGSWANIMSRVRKALELAGVKVHRQRRNFTLSPAWEELVAPLSTRDRRDIRRFAGWCSVREISPQDVTPSTFEQFYAYLEQQMIQRNPRERGHVARRAWSRAIALPGSPYQPVPAPEPITKCALRWEDFPQTLQDEVRAYAVKAVTADPFDEGHRPIKPITLSNYLTRLRVMATTLIEAGVPVDRFQTLADLIDPSLVKRAFTLRLPDGEIDDRARKDLGGMAVGALSVARYLDLDDHTREELKNLARKVRFRSSGMCEKNKARLIPLFDPLVRRKLLNLPVRIADQLGKVKEPTVRQAQQMQMAVLLDLLLHVPLRIRNVSELDISKTIVPPVAGSVGNWRIAIDATDVKNGWAIDAELGDELGDMLDRYVNVFRPVLSKMPSTAFFISQSGLRKGPSVLSKQLAAFVRREIGVTIHAHLMRHLAAHLYLIANPGDYETVRRLLGHKHLETTVSFYEGLLTDDAFARYDALIAELRKQADIKSSKPSNDSDDLEEGDFL